MRAEVLFCFAFQAFQRAIFASLVLQYNISLVFLRRVMLPGGCVPSVENPEHSHPTGA